MSDIVIVGFPDSSKVPGAFGETKFGQSPIKFGTSANKILICGLKNASGGNLALDTEVRRLYSKEDAVAAWGAGAEGHLGAMAAFNAIAGMDGAEIYGCAPTGAGGSTATCTITVTGPATANGTIKITVAGEEFEVAVTNGDTANTVAASINTKANTVANLCATSGVATNVATLTSKWASIRANQIAIYVDTTLAPGITIALGGAGAALTSTTNIVGRYFGGGAGVETLTTLLGTLFPQRYQFICPAQNDATSLALWEAQIDAKAGPLENRIERIGVASSLNFAGATSLAQTTLNEERAQLMWLEASENLPFAVACAFTAIRAVTEAVDPNASYDDVEVKGIRGQRMQGYWVSGYTAQQAALDVGVTPLESRADGKVYVVRSITTRCLDGAQPDYRVLDTSESYVPDWVREDLSLLWNSSFKVANPHVRPNPGPNEKDLPAGVAYPDLWAQVCLQRMLEHQRNLIVTQVEANKPFADYNSAANRIMSVIPVIPLPHQHQVGLSIRQMNVAA